MLNTILVLQIVVTNERWSCNSVVVNDRFHCNAGQTLNYGSIWTQIFAKLSHTIYFP